MPHFLLSGFLAYGMNVDNFFSDAAQKPSLWVLVLANLVPLVGVLFWGWSQAAILLLYWSESAIVGLFTLMKMAMAKKYPKHLQVNNQPVFVKSDAELNRLKWFLVPFFLFHFGIFMIVHLAFLLAFVSLELSWSLAFGFLLSFFTLFVSHAYSYYVNFLGKKMFNKNDAGSLLFSPYPRIFLMHAVVLLGVFGGFPVLVLVLGKIILDVASHAFEHGWLRFSTPRQA